MQVPGLGSGRPRWGECYDTRGEIHTGGSEVVVYRGFRWVFKIERPSGHDLISSDESKRRNDSKPGRVDSFAANGVDIVDCDIKIDIWENEW